MTVYVDNAFIPATVPNGQASHTSKWCHLFADTPEELHEFAAQLGLRRSYFQEGKPRGDGSRSPHWHYDVTEGKRWQALKLGAREVEWRDTPGIMRERDAPAAEGKRPEVHGIPGVTRPAENERDESGPVKGLDYRAGVAYKEGRYLDAARILADAKRAHPREAELWARRADAVMTAIRARNEPVQENDRPLDEIVEERLTRAGVKPGEPEITQLREWNLARLAQDREISNTPEPATDREAIS